MSVETQDEVLEQEEVEQAEQTEGETPSDEQSAAEQDDGEVVITIGDEAPAAQPEDELEGRQAPQWLKEMRKRDREQAKRIRELESREAERQAAAAPKAEDVGPKPTLESCDYDAEAYAEKLVAWNDRKKAADAKLAVARQEQEALQAEWNNDHESYRDAGAQLKLAGGFEEAEAVVKAALDPVKHAILVQGPKSAKLAAQLVGALSSSPAKLKELAAIKNPVKYAFALADIVAQLKVQPRSPAPAPERQVRGSAGGATGVDNNEARLEAEADRTGDRTKLIQYRIEKKRRQAA